MALNLQRTASVSLAVDNPATRYVGSFSKVVQDVATYTKGASGELVLATGTTDIPIAGPSTANPALPVGMTNGKLLYLEYDQTITVRFDTAATGSFRILELPANSPTGIFLATCQFTQVFFTNASGVTANIGWIVAGT